MFYEPEKDDHGLPFNPYKSIVVPRPIGWISTMSRDGIVNLAPYSQFNNLGYDPPYVMFSGNCFPETGRPKDSVKNATDRRVRGEHGDVRTARGYQHHVAVPRSGTNEAALAGLHIFPLASSSPRALRHRRSTWNANSIAR